MGGGLIQPPHPLSKLGVLSTPSKLMLPRTKKETGHPTTRKTDRGTNRDKVGRNSDTYTNIHSKAI